MLEVDAEFELAKVFRSVPVDWRLTWSKFVCGEITTLEPHVLWLHEMKHVVFGTGSLEVVPQRLGDSEAAKVDRVLAKGELG